MERNLIKYLWNLGDKDFINYAIMKARPNKKERDVLHYMLDECMTQEETAEVMNMSTRNIQKIWKNACDKILRVPGVAAYAKELKDGGCE